MSKPVLAYDIEVYRNYFLVSFLNIVTKNILHFEMFPGHPLDAERVLKVLRAFTLVSFNGNNFDLPLLSLAVQGADCEKIKSYSDRIILNNLKYWTLGIDPIECDHIDLIEVAPGMASLKIYGGRMHAPKLQDLPIDPDADISAEDREQLKTYCENDLHTTALLYETLLPQIQLREQLGEKYRMDLRSKSDAQIAEAVIRSEVELLLNNKLRKPVIKGGHAFHYEVPHFIWFQTEPPQRALEVIRQTTFMTNDSGSVKKPKEISDLKVTIGNSTYQMGIGGLHSTEKRAAHVSDDEYILVDRDVASYYPSIILNCGLKPAQMGDHFTNVYRDIVRKRLEAKRNGDKVTADSLKITINGSFGKFGSPYSVLYSPELLIQTTLTGQLSLLMLIEMLESEGIPVVSANTDGIVIKCPRNLRAMMDFIIWEWEMRTGFETEETHYTALYSRDVSNYIAIKDQGYKVKGAYTPAALQKNPVNEIVTDAILAKLKFGQDIAQTVRNCDDIRKFVTIRTVKGGAVDQAGQFLGKAIRWYYAHGVDGPLTYKINGYTVPRSEGARPLMELPDTLPDDIDYDWYIQEAHSVLTEIGAAA
jgi:hypothetical protein